MNRLEYYDRQKEDWLEDELQALRSRYENQDLTISQIGDAHRRTPGAMASKLKSIGVIPIMWQARGYAEYKNSNLYKEICENKYVTEYEKTIQKQSNITEPNALLRKGKKWEDDEVLKLLTSIQKKKSVADIAAEHERSPSAINAQRKKLAADYWFNDKKSIEYISKWTGLSKGEIEEAVERRQLKDQSRTEHADAKNSLKEKKGPSFVNSNKKMQASLELEVSELKDEVKNLKAQLCEIQKGLKPVIKRNVVNV